jgi:thiamine biosynthesis protein ThiS
MTTQVSHEPSSLALTVNGEVRSVSPGMTLAAFLTEFELDPRMVVVELNRAILRDRDAYASMSLNSGDVLEIVHFVGGG